MAHASLRILYDRCGEDIARIFEPIIDKSEDQGVHQAHEWVDLLVWNILVAFAVGVSSNATFAGIAELFRRRGRLSRADLDSHQDELERSQVESDDETASRRLITEVVVKLTSQQPTEAQLDELVKLINIKMTETGDGS